MPTAVIRKILICAGAATALWLGLRYLLPALLPFVLGGVVAVAAEPLVHLCCRKLKLGRSWAAGIGVTATLLLLGTVVWLAGAVAVKELVVLANDMPDIQDTALQGMTMLEQWLLSLSQKTPGSVRPLLEKTVEQTFQDSADLFSRLTRQIPGAVTGVLSWVPKGVLSLFTGVVAGFMISARLPRIRSWLTRQIPPVWKQKYLPTLAKARHALGGWLMAQLKLALVTWAVVAIGFLLLKIRYGILWAALVALVDAVPVLGTGTVLVPWAAVCFLQGQPLRGIGMLCIYGGAMILRTVLEPRLVGRHLGLDPLVTLMAFYAGFTFWGVAGMLLAPVAAAAVSALIHKNRP